MNPNVPKGKRAQQFLFTFSLVFPEISTKNESIWIAENVLKCLNIISAVFHHSCQMAKHLIQTILQPIEIEHMLVEGRSESGRVLEHFPLFLGF